MTAVKSCGTILMFQLQRKQKLNQSQTAPPIYSIQSKYNMKSQQRLYILYICTNKTNINKKHLRGTKYKRYIHITKYVQGQCGERLFSNANIFKGLEPERLPASE